MNLDKSEIILENISKALKEESIKYDSGNIIIVKNNNGEEKVSKITFEELIESPNNYLKHAYINIYILLINFIENNELENIKKIVNKKLVGSECYDSAIDAILNNKIRVSKTVSIDIIKLLYNNISLPLREYFLGNCISHANSDDLIDWIIETLNNEPYLEISKILLHTTNMDKSIFYKLIEICPFDLVKNDLFMIMFQNLENANIFINVYNEKNGVADFLDIPSNKIMPLIISKIMVGENKNLGEFLFKHVKLDSNEVYVWLLLGFLHNKFDMINFILENSNINKIDSNTTYNCLSFCENINLELLNYLIKNEKFYGKIDFTCVNHHIMRQAITNEKIEIVKFLLENNTYPEYKNLKENELLNDTLEFFASEEITSYIKKYYNIEE